MLQDDRYFEVNKSDTSNQRIPQSGQDKNIGSAPTVETRGQSTAASRSTPSNSSPPQFSLPGGSTDSRTTEHRTSCSSNDSTIKTNMYKTTHGNEKDPIGVPSSQVTAQQV
nr:unnamed protein product [Callosobruchus analis]